MSVGTTGQATPRERRAVSRADLARVLRRSLDRHDVTQGQVADSVGIAASKVGRWCDPTAAERPTIADVTLMPRPIAITLLRWAAEAHGVEVVDAIAVETVSDHLRHLYTCIREGADVTSTYASAIADGQIDATERRQLIAELEQDLSAKASLRRALLDDEAAYLAMMRRVS